MRPAHHQEFHHRQPSTSVVDARYRAAKYARTLARPRRRRSRWRSPRSRPRSAAFRPRSAAFRRKRAHEGSPRGSVQEVECFFLQARPVCAKGARPVLTLGAQLVAAWGEAQKAHLRAPRGISLRHSGHGMISESGSGVVQESACPACVLPESPRPGHRTLTRTESEQQPSSSIFMPRDSGVSAGRRQTCASPS